MDFWVWLLLFALICIFVERLLMSPLNKAIPYIFIGVLWFISAFRYMIGWDYESYIYLFNVVEIGDVYPEISFTIIATLLREFGFDFQMIFVVYSTIMYFFLWKGISRYSNDTSVKLLALVVFMISKDLMWGSFSVIRQFVAITIIFWGSFYVIKRSFYKYFASVILAFFFHYSALVFLLLYFIPREKFKLKVYILGITASFLILYTGILPKIMGNLLSYIGMYESYLSSNELQYSSGIVLYFYTLLIVIFFYFIHKHEAFFLNSYFLYLVIVILFSFSAPIARLKEYVLVFYIMTYSWLIIRINSRIQNILGYILIIPLIIIYISAIQAIHVSYDGVMHSYFSANNIDFQFNFDIFME